VVELPVSPECEFIRLVGIPAKRGNPLEGVTKVTWLTAFVTGIELDDANEEDEKSKTC